MRCLLENYKSTVGLLEKLCTRSVCVCLLIHNNLSSFLRCIQTKLNLFIVIQCSAAFRYYINNNDEASIFQPTAGI